MHDSLTINQVSYIVGAEHRGIEFQLDWEPQMQRIIDPIEEKMTDGIVATPWPL